LGNSALDLLGQSSAFYKFAAEIEQQNHTEDDFIYFRDEMHYKNIKLVELPKGDFAFTIARQFFFSQYSILFFELMQKSSNTTIAGISSKALKEVTYHLRHSKQWMLRLGDGTEESHLRLQNAVNELWNFTGEMFYTDATENLLTENKIIPPLDLIQSLWKEQIEDCFSAATILLPHNGFQHSGGRIGKHTEHLGYLLSELQILARSYPDAKW